MSQKIVDNWLSLAKYDMDQDQAIIREKVLRFYQVARQLFPIKKMLLYGSHAEGTATKDSDIDVAVVVDQMDHSK